jgi:hypothetical protein
VDIKDAHGRVRLLLMHVTGNLDHRAVADTFCTLRDCTSYLLACRQLPEFSHGVAQLSSDGSVRGEEPEQPRLAVQ